MKPALLIIALLATGCSSLASSAPDPGATSVVQQFTEITWPNVLTINPSWTQTFFFFGRPPRIISTGQSGSFATGATIDVRSRGGDTLVALSFSAQGNGVASVQAKAFVFDVVTGSAELIADVFDQRRPPGLTMVGLPLKEPHLMTPNDSVALQLDDDGQGYEVLAVQATWTRPL
jgi:hypothetical protein